MASTMQPAIPLRPASPATAASSVASSPARSFIHDALDSVPTSEVDDEDDDDGGSSFGEFVGWRPTSPPRSDTAFYARSPEVGPQRAAVAPALEPDERKPPPPPPAVPPRRAAPRTTREFAHRKLAPLVTHAFPDGRLTLAQTCALLQRATLPIGSPVTDVACALLAPLVYAAASALCVCAAALRVPLPVSTRLARALWWALPLVAWQLRGVAWLLTPAAALAGTVAGAPLLVRWTYRFVSWLWPVGTRAATAPTMLEALFAAFPTANTVAFTDGLRCVAHSGPLLWVPEYIAMWAMAQTALHASHTEHAENVAWNEVPLAHIAEAFRNE